MEDLGDIIYFILVAVVAISSLFGKSKKKKPAAEQAEPKKSVFQELEQSWEEFEEMLEKPKPKPATASPSKPYSTPRGSAETIAPMEYEALKYEPLSYDSATDFKELRVKKQMKESVFKTHSSFRVFDLDEKAEEEASPIHVSLDNAEDARMAFIYSEIFNRKYS